MKSIKSIILVACAALSLVSGAEAAAQLKTPVKGELKTVVIDPGHGGKHPGAIYGNVREKDLTLAVSLHLGQLIKARYPDIRVIFTRTGDQFVELYKRAEIANREHADIFISIHANASKDPAAHGSETYLMGLDKSNANLSVYQAENSVVAYEDDYSSNYDNFDPDDPSSYIIFAILQNIYQEQSIMLADYIQQSFHANGPIKYNRGVKQAPFLVLWRCTMP